MKQIAVLKDDPAARGLAGAAPDADDPPYLLVIDMAEASRSALAYLLRDRGYAVCDVGSAWELPGAGASLPILIIFDPGPFRAEALATVRAITSRPGSDAIRVLLLGAGAAGEERDRALAAGCVEFLAKPCYPAELIAAVERIVGPPRPHDRVPPTPLAAPEGA